MGNSESSGITGSKNEHTEPESKTAENGLVENDTLSKSDLGLSSLRICPSASPVNSLVDLFVFRSKVYDQNNLLISSEHVIPRLGVQQLNSWHNIYDISMIKMKEADVDQQKENEKEAADCVERYIKVGLSNISCVNLDLLNACLIPSIHIFKCKKQESGLLDVNQYANDPEKQLVAYQNTCVYLGSCEELNVDSQKCMKKSVITVPVEKAEKQQNNTHANTPQQVVEMLHTQAYHKTIVQQVGYREDVMLHSSPDEGLLFVLTLGNNTSKKYLCEEVTVPPHSNTSPQHAMNTTSSSPSPLPSSNSPKVSDTNNHMIPRNSISFPSNSPRTSMVVPGSPRNSIILPPNSPRGAPDAAQLRSRSTSKSQHGMYNPNRRPSINVTPNSITPVPMSRTTSIPNMSLSSSHNSNTAIQPNVQPTFIPPTPLHIHDKPRSVSISATPVVTPITPLKTCSFFSAHNATSPNNSVHTSLLHLNIPDNNTTTSTNTNSVNNNENNNTSIISGRESGLLTQLHSPHNTVELQHASVSTTVVTKSIENNTKSLQPVVVGYTFLNCTDLGKKMDIISKRRDKENKTLLYKVPIRCISTDKVWREIFAGEEVSFSITPK